MQTDPPALHPYKLRSIELKDFKSISHAKVDFQPLTVIVGANSSGKSSLIQAILALSQAVQSEDTTGHFPLNGELVRLGTFEETKNFISEDPDSPIYISVDIQIEQYNAKLRRGHIQTGDIPADDSKFYLDKFSEARSYSIRTCVSWGLCLDAGEKPGNGSLRIQSVRMEAEKFNESLTQKLGDLDYPHTFILEYQDSFGNFKGYSAVEGHEASDGVNPIMRCELLNFSSNLTETQDDLAFENIAVLEGSPIMKVSGEFIDWSPWWWVLENPICFEAETHNCDAALVVGQHVGGLASGRPLETHNCDAALVVGGIPHVVYTRRNIIDTYGYCWWNNAYHELYFGRNDPYGKALSSERHSSVVTDTLAVDYAEKHVGLLYEVKSEAEADRNILRKPIDDLEVFGSIVRDSIESLPDQARYNLAKNMIQVGKTEFLKLLSERFIEHTWAAKVVLDKSEQPDNMTRESIEICSTGIGNFFNQSIRYLRPLRAAPRVLYDPNVMRLDLGINGEYAAAVLHAQANRIVLRPEVDGSCRHTDLSSALAYWLQHFGMADLLQTEDRGRLGFDLKVSPPPFDRFVDLTSVGVGVSQVLPVLLLCLLAEPGDLVILEQPELHLHPALQHKLADFLLECTRSGRQILVETHSEHLINRLRRRAAEDDSDETQLLIGLLFAEQHEGQTTFSESKINAYGGLSRDWPDGFLDVGAREAQHLVRNSVYKYRRRQDREESLTDEGKNGVEP